MLPDVYFGDVTESVDWRNAEFEDQSSDDDEELAATPSDVVDILGFDPRGEFSKSDEDVIKAGNGIMIAWFPPAGLSDRLAQDGGELPEELHVTLAYLGKQTALMDDQVQLLKDTVEEYCARFAPLHGTLGGNGRFPATPSSDDKDVLIKMMDVTLLEKFREGLVEELGAKGISVVRNHGYTPHMTLAYVDPEWEGECTHPDTEDIVIDALTVAVGDERIVYPLNGDEVLKMEPTLSQVHSDAPLGDSKVWRVTWADGRAKVYFDTQGAAREFYQSHDGDEIREVERPAGVRIRKDEDLDFHATIAKVDKDQQLVFGWVTIAEEGGKPLVDRQGDVITPDDMEKMAYNFVLHCRKAGEMHERVGVGKLVESIVFTKEKQKALGVDLGKVGWWVGFYISDPAVWAKVKSGEYSAFSIHGKGVRTKIDEEV